MAEWQEEEIIALRRDVQTQGKLLESMSGLLEKQTQVIVAIGEVLEAIVEPQAPYRAHDVAEDSHAMPTV